MRPDTQRHASNGREALLGSFDYEHRDWVTVRPLIEPRGARKTLTRRDTHPRSD
jgi:hypothetical protein